MTKHLKIIKRPSLTFIVGTAALPYPTGQGFLYQMLNIAEQFWTMLSNTEQCWAMLSNAEQILKWLTGGREGEIKQLPHAVRVPIALAMLLCS